LAAGSNLGGAGDALLDLAIFFLLGEFVLDGELGLVDEGLFFEVEVVLGLECVEIVDGGDLGRVGKRVEGLVRMNRPKREACRSDHGRQFTMRGNRHHWLFPLN